MRFTPPLLPATFIARPNRFLARVEVSGRRAWAHVHDPGRLQELLTPGAQLLLRPASGARKTPYDVMLVKTGRTWVSIYSSLPNRLVKVSLERRELPELGEYPAFSREVRYDNSRFDFRLDTDPPLWIEVKSASLVINRVALFPDAPTERGRRHIDHLIELVRNGQRATVLFVVQRSDARSLRPNGDTDPDFADACRRAATVGVAFHARTCRLTANSISLGSPIPVVL